MGSVVDVTVEVVTLGPVAVLVGTVLVVVVVLAVPFRGGTVTGRVVTLFPSFASGVRSSGSTTTRRT
jgi:hypothetical protein